MIESDVIIVGHGSGTPSTKNLATYNQSRYESFAKNGKRKGIVCVRRLRDLNDTKRNEFATTIKQIIGRNIYSQMLRQYVYRPYKDGKFYSDCSSCLCATLQEIGYDVGLLNTAAIYESPKFDTVPVQIQNGHILAAGLLKVGDFLLYRGNDPARPEQIGHVEAVYSMPSKMPVYPIDATLTATETVNVRAGAGIEFNIIGTVPKGSIVKASAKCGEWFQIEFSGWVSRKYVQGWIYEPQKDDVRNWWYIDRGSYPISTVKDINGRDYAFDRDGWLVEQNRIAESGYIIY